MTPHLFINSITMKRIIMFISLISSHNFGVDVKKKMTYIIKTTLTLIY